MPFDDIGTIRNYSRQYHDIIRSTDTGPDDRATLHAITSLIQEAASSDAEHLGFGADTLDGQSLCWLLLRTSVRFDDHPKWREEITVDTWTNGTEKLLALRDFCITGTDGRALARASTSWLLADRMTKRPQRVDILGNRRMTEFHYSSLGFSSPRIDESHVSFPDRPLILKQAAFSDIDRNGHVNNTRYIAWCLDAVFSFLGTAPRMTGFDINYISEVTIGEDIAIHCTEYPAEKAFGNPWHRVLIARGTHSSDGRTSFVALLYITQVAEDEIT
jgi:medium-chain acyl-[acyl-carrier-protein] hydrolase